MSGHPVARRLPPDGREIRTDDDQPTFWDRVEGGRWEPGTLLTLDRLVLPGMVVLDLGAWIGALSLFCALRGAQVVSVEADPAALDQLRRNLAVNPDLAAAITVVPRAVSARPGPIRLGARRKPGDSMSSALLAGSATSWSVETVTPGDLPERVAGRGRLLVKLDIEGGEYDLLPALGPVLDLADHLLVSFHPDILRESGGVDPVPPTRAALAPLRRWRAARIGEGGPEPASCVPEAIDTPETWLFSHPERD